MTIDARERSVWVLDDALKENGLVYEDQTEAVRAVLDYLTDTIVNYEDSWFPQNVVREYEQSAAIRAFETVDDYLDGVQCEERLFNRVTDLDTIRSEIKQMIREEGN